MFRQDAPPPAPPVPEPTDVTAQRRANEVRRRRARGGRATTVRPSRESEGGGSTAPQPAANPISGSGSRFGGAFGAGLGVFPGLDLK